MDERFAYSIFCDDIRTENNGKQIFIGVYSGAMIVPRFPTTLPSFCIALTIQTPSERPFKQLRVRIVKDDDELFSHELPIEKLEVIKIEGNDKKEDDDATVQQLRTETRFNAFEITEETRIRVRVDTEEGELRGGAILIRTPTSSERASIPSPLSQPIT